MIFQQLHIELSPDMSQFSWLKWILSAATNFERAGSSWRAISCFLLFKAPTIVWILGHQHLYVSAEIKITLAGKGAAEHNRIPSLLPLCVLLCVQTCLFLQGITQGGDCILVPNGTWEMYLFPSLQNQLSVMLVYMFKVRLYTSYSSELWNRNSRNMDRGFKDILIKGIHTESKYYFTYFFTRILLVWISWSISMLKLCFNKSFLLLY